MGQSVLRSRTSSEALLGLWVRGRAALFVALTFAGVVGALAPARAIDDAVRRWAVRVVSPREAPTRVILMTVSPDDVRSGACRTTLYDLLRQGGASGAVSWSHAASLCASTAQADSATAALGFSNLLLAPDGRIDGLTQIRDARLQTLGIRDGRWIASAPGRIVPGLRLDDLVEGHVPPATLAKRVVVVALEGGPEAGVGDFLDARSVASALDGVLEGRTAEDAPRWAGALSALALSMAALLFRDWPFRWRAVVFVGIAGTLVGVELLGAWMAWAALLPLPSIALATTIAVGSERLPRRLLGRRLLKRAVADAETTKSVPETDGAFFSGVSRLAGYLHPADFVLVAERMSKGSEDRSEIVFRAADSSALALVAEPNRDITRAPYCDEEGHPRTGVLSGFLVMREMPVVCVALTVRGVLEGFVFLCGQKAADAFAKDPRRSQRVARDLGGLLRQRRMERGSDSSRVASAVDEGDSNVAVAHLLSRAKARADLAALAARHLPDAMITADSLGDVRSINRKMIEALSAAGMDVARLSDGAELPRGTLFVDQVIGQLKAAEPTDLGEIFISAHRRAEGITLPVSPAADAKPMFLTLRVLRRKTHGAIVPAGYVAVLRELRPTVTGASIPPDVARFAPADGLQVVRLWEELGSVVDKAARASSRQIRLASKRGSALVIAQRGTVFPALTAFLVEGAKLQVDDRPPFVTIRERSNNVEIAIRDLRLGIPRATLERIVETPTVAPMELETLTTLLHAVEDSQGQARVAGDEAWGADLILRFIRARVAVGRLSDAPPRMASVRPIKRRVGSDPPSRH